MAQPMRFQAVVDQVTRHNPDLATYRLRACKRLPRFIPGQFIHLTIDSFDPTGFWPESRIFSVANAVADRYTIELTISRQGLYTGRILDGLLQGAQVWAKGPYGDFTIDASHGYGRAVLIAGGTGITPFCAFMDAVLKQGSLPVSEVTLHYGAQAPDLLIYRALADQCAAAIPDFQVHYYAEKHTDSADPQVQTGRIDLRNIICDNKLTQETAFFLSGPKSMIQSLRDGLIHTHRVSTEQVLIDAWE
ncbi:ferredoxin--NADP reductase [Lamprocystis purpurea]|jgi:ferredoxin-NADP reductase|uniref:ferredoxin--NADP reductase n=1 Tax=Lamprocystis purpurea TaxID=61598 RepID=UPI00037A66C1|nr:FAD-dependent oxidoreductase [Lamprocystis purpurea]